MKLRVLALLAGAAGAVICPHQKKRQGVKHKYSWHPGVLQNSSSRRRRGGDDLRQLAGGAEGAVYVINKHRFGAMNLRTSFERIIERAGLSPWPKLFHNLRASRESELMREYDLATVCKWIGNSPTIAAKHYATSVDLDADFKRAIGAAQKAAQHGAELSAMENKAAQGDVEKSPEISVDCTPCASVQSGGMGRIRLERMTSSV